MFRRKPKEVLDPPVWLIAGLGNPGVEYAGTRHNVGFEVIDRLASAHKCKLDVRKHRAVYGLGHIEGVSVVLVKPMTYMNLSGLALAEITRHYGLKPDHVLVVADDLDLSLGRIRLRPEGGAGGHNGHKSIIQSLGTQAYPRLRIGIGKAAETIDHVLSRFSPEERTTVNEAIEKAVRSIKTTLDRGVDAAMAEFNAE
ncbi:MAG: aminoacyl-tRNA hydrolase [Fimbriimonadaceae bacterium]|nr:aminoacyl-tRNA hydrolase [Fimbriimonadaceae bacterium]